jgi:hypothetical protein
MKVRQRVNLGAAFFVLLAEPDLIALQRTLTERRA